MTGPEHYREAEKLLADVDRTVAPSEIPIVLAIAQVHATLALAAASAWPVVDRYKGDSPLVNEWSDAIGWVMAAEIAAANIGGTS